MNTCKYELKNGKCGKDMYILYKQVTYCKTHFDKINDNICKHTKKDGDECGKKAGYTKDDKIFYCKTHFNKLNVIKAKSDSCSKCSKKATNSKDNINYCNAHFNDLSAKICKGKLVNGKNCTKKASLVKNGLDYCKVHHDKLDQVICSNVSHRGTKCTKKAFAGSNLCSAHLVNVTVDRTIETKEPTLLDKIDSIKKIKLDANNKNTIKKDIHKILLQVHPDKCKIPYFNSEQCTKDMNNILERIKNL